MGSTVDQMKENKGKVALLGGLLLACAVVAWWNFKPQAAPKPVVGPNTAPISEEEKKVGEEQIKRIQQIEKTRPSSGA